MTLTGDVLYLQTEVPGFVIGAVHGSKIMIYVLGERAPGEDASGDDMVIGGRLDHQGLTGPVLVALAADSTVAVAQTLCKPPPILETDAETRICSITRPISCAMGWIRSRAWTSLRAHGCEEPWLGLMIPEGNRPLILQKRQASYGELSYINFALTRGVAAFGATFDFSAAIGIPSTR